MHFDCLCVCVFTAGVVDEDYRGNVGVVLFNFGKETFEGEFCHWYLGIGRSIKGPLIDRHLMSLLDQINFMPPGGIQWQQSEMFPLVASFSM